MKTQFSLISLLFSISLISNTAFSKSTVVLGPELLEQRLNEALEFSPEGTEIILPEGRFMMTNELVITKAGIKIKGQGMHKTTLSFRNQKVGSQGVFGSADALVFEDFGIEDSAGNGLKVVSANSVTFRRMRVAWTDGPREENGAYALYPVMSRNVLIEDCEISGASDAGIYVGQSQNIIVRRNKAFQNVAGIEIENSTYADVYENEAYDNTAGILVFNLPDLPVKGGKQTRVFNNKVYNNNHPNFATPGSIIHLVPKGLGIFIMANSEVEIFKNEIYDNRLTGIAIANYYVSERKFTDKAYDPMPRHIYIYENNFSAATFSLFSQNKMSLIIKILLGLRTPEIIYDGIDDGTYVGSKPTEYDRICIQRNTTREGKPVRYGNLHLDNQRKWYPFPGGPATTDLAPHDCEHARFPEIQLEAPPVILAKTPSKTQQEINQICSRQVKGVNWAALEYDCPKLSDYGLFQNTADATSQPSERGFQYKLNNELFTDYADKSRFIFLPPQTQMQYTSEGVFDFPVGTVITKTFSFHVPVDSATAVIPIETRLLIKRKSGWVASDYLWDLDKKEAQLFLGGTVKPMKILAHGRDLMNIEYGVPNRRQCASCHETNTEIARGQLSPIGPKAKFLNWLSDGKNNQLVEFARLGYLKGLPANISEVPTLPQWDQPETGPLDLRAKAYLEMNCAHCHSPVGPAKNTGLYLMTNIASDTAMMGHCKRPTAAGIGSGGRPVDVAPGRAEDSILLHRMQHSQLAVRMPQLGRTVAHKEANAMIEEWINKMTPVECDR